MRIAELMDAVRSLAGASIPHSEFRIPH